MSRRSFIYFIGPKDGPVKIGFSINPFERRADLQTGNHSDLFIFGLMPGDESDERELHARFSESSIRGEWFQLTDDLRQFINDKTTPVSEEVWCGPGKIGRFRKPNQTSITGNKLSDKILAAVSASPSGLSRTEISDSVFRKNVPCREIQHAINNLVSLSLVERRTVPTGGRDKELLVAQ